MVTLKSRIEVENIDEVIAKTNELADCLQRLKTLSDEINKSSIAIKLEKE